MRIRFYLPKTKVVLSEIFVMLALGILFVVIALGLIISTPR